MPPQTNFWRQLFVYARCDVRYPRDIGDHFERYNVTRGMYTRISSRSAVDVNLQSSVNEKYDLGVAGIAPSQDRPHCPARRPSLAHYHWLRLYHR